MNKKCPLSLLAIGLCSVTSLAFASPNNIDTIDSMLKSNHAGASLAEREGPSCELNAALRLADTHVHENSDVIIFGHNHDNVDHGRSRSAPISETLVSRASFVV